MENLYSQNVFIKEYYALGTTIRFMFFNEGFEKGLNMAVEKIYDVENKMSVFKEESQISRVNKWANFLPIKTSPELYNLIEMAVEYSKMTNGAFDSPKGTF